MLLLMSTQRRYEKILQLRIVDGLTFEQIAKRLGVSRQRIWQCYSRAIGRCKLSLARESSST